MSLSERVGRNDPCPCGSGLKYKKCCLSLDSKKEEAETSKEPRKRTEDVETDFQEGKEEKQVEQEEQEVEPKMEYEDVSDDDAVQLYAKEFAQRGYNIRLEVLRTFFHRCLQKDGVVDSQRVEELCDYQRKHERVVITSENVNQFFDEL
ncbi:MAG: SEC-C metal-binding domain-containing protein [Archaeoglobaceae archaeon]